MGGRSESYQRESCGKSDAHRLTLRAASNDDAYLLFAWRNDAEARRAYFNEDFVQLGEHILWLSRKLANRDSQLLIAEVGSLPVGQVRIDSGAISYSVASEHRCLGYGRAIIAAVTQPGRIARVKLENTPSRRIFESLGWRTAKTDDKQITYTV